MNFTVQVILYILYSPTTFVSLIWLRRLLCLNYRMRWTFIDQRFCVDLYFPTLIGPLSLEKKLPLFIFFFILFVVFLLISLPICKEWEEKSWRWSNSHSFMYFIFDNNYPEIGNYHICWQYWSVLMPIQRTFSGSSAAWFNF